MLKKPVKYSEQAPSRPQCSDLNFSLSILTENKNPKNENLSKNQHSKWISWDDSHGMDKILQNKVSLGPE